MTSGTALLRGEVHTGSRVLPGGWVHLTGGVVTGVGQGPAPRADREFAGHRVVAGFVDLHCHGGGGSQFGGTGGAPADAVREAARTVAGTHREHGTTTLVASLVTRPLDELARTLRALRPLVDDGTLAGAHLEGPWLSPPRSGAHAAALLRDPDPADVAALLATGVVRVVTLAPELPGGLDAVRAVTDAGALAAVGHTDADAEAVLAAVDAGARVATHLFNAMPPVHHRRPGPVLALLSDSRVTIELIADGVHLHPLVVAHAVASAGPGRVALVSDAMAAAGCPDGRYALGDLDVEVVGGRARLAGGGPIAGSTLTLDAALRWATTTAGVPFAEALAAVTTTPAGLLGLPRRGHLEPGADGGAVVLDEDLRVTAVVAG